MGAFGIIAILSGLYAIVGNIAVHAALVERKVPVRFMWSGTPFYLYNLCVREPEKAGIGLRKFAFSTNIAFFLAFAMAFLETVFGNH